jgi:hypothetical protein
VEIRSARYCQNCVTQTDTVLTILYNSLHVAFISKCSPKVRPTWIVWPCNELHLHMSTPRFWFRSLNCITRYCCRDPIPHWSQRCFLLIALWQAHGPYRRKYANRYRHCLKLYNNKLSGVSMGGDTGDACHQNLVREGAHVFVPSPDFTQR